MYRASILLMMVFLPLISILVENRIDGAPWTLLIAKWFVFWALGVRVFLAGVMQVTRPRFTAHRIFHFQTDDALPIVRELGIANAAAGVVAIASIANPAFVLPMAIFGTIFYGGASVGHILGRERSDMETFAMVTDIFAFVVLAAIVAWRLL